MKQSTQYFKILQAVFLSLLLILVTNVLLAQEKVLWDYPTKPGTESWRMLKNNQEKVAACQIPEQWLTEIKTANLLEICLNYPLLPDIFAFNDIEDGFKKFEHDFNGFREFIIRKNGFKELLRAYKEFDPTALPKAATILEKGNYVLRFSFIELFATHTLLTKNSSVTIKKDFINELVKKKKEKKLKPEWYNTIGIQTNVYATVKIIKSETDVYDSKLNNSDLYSFINTGKFLTPNVQDLIDQVVTSFIITKK